MKTVLNNNYLICSEDNRILKELLEDKSIINWYNFKNADIYYSNDDKTYQLYDINKKEKTLYIKLVEWDEGGFII